MELREKLLTLRKANGMTQDELAKALYVSRQSVYK
ncbi:MAG: helix-turn-helix domain-containing protein [Clostridia bacterium]